MHAPKAQLSVDATTDKIPAPPVKAIKVIADCEQIAIGALPLIAVSV